MLILLIPLCYVAWIIYRMVPETPFLAYVTILSTIMNIIGIFIYCTSSNESMIGAIFVGSGLLGQVLSIGFYSIIREMRGQHIIPTKKSSDDVSISEESDY